MGLLVKTKGKKNYCILREVPIIAARNRHFVLIQVDKIVYKPGDKVNFRILVLDQETKPFKYRSINVKVINNNQSITNNFEVGESSEFSLYENNFELLDVSSLGKWRIVVTVDGSQHSSSKSFLVKDFKPPPFQIFIETAPRVAFTVVKPVINLKIYAKLPSEVMVTGTVNIKTKSYLADSPENVQASNSFDIQITDGFIIKKFDVKRDLGITSLTKPAIAEFNVEITQDKTGKKSMQTQKVEVIPVGRHSIKLIKQDTFKPGFSYKIQAFVFKINGELEESTSMPLTMRAKYNHKVERQSETTITNVSFLKNGTASFLLQPENDAMDLDLQFEFEDLVHREAISSQKEVGDDTEFMQITYEPER